MKTKAPKVFRRLVGVLIRDGVSKKQAHAIAYKKLQAKGYLKPGTLKPTKKNASDYIRYLNERYNEQNSRKMEATTTH